MQQHLDLAEFVETMFQVDGAGRLTGDAPYLYVLRTRDSVVCRSHAELPQSCAEALEAIARRPRGRPGEWALEYGRYLTALGAHRVAGAIRAGPLYRFPDIDQEEDGCVRIDASNAHLLEGELDEWVPDAALGLPMAAALAEGRAVSVCATVRAAKTIHCAGVETSPSHRGNGSASKAVAAWARQVRALGAEPFYATTFDNLASQHVARRLGLEPVGSEFSIYRTV